MLTFNTIMIVSFEDVSRKTPTIITPCRIGTVMGTPSIVGETLINIYDNSPYLLYRPKFLWDKISFHENFLIFIFMNQALRHYDHRMLQNL